MKKIFLIVITLVSSFVTMAQDTIKVKEVGILFNNLNNFGLTYKLGNSNAVWRINSLLISGSSVKENLDTLERSRKSAGFAIKLGKEFRKTISDKLEFRYGADVFFDYRKQEFVSSNSTFGDETYRPGVNLVIGFNYLLSENLLLGAELLPSFNYLTGRSTSSGAFNSPQRIEGFEYGLSNTSALITLAYRF